MTQRSGSRTGTDRYRPLMISLRDAIRSSGAVRTLFALGLMFTSPRARGEAAVGSIDRLTRAAKFAEGSLRHRIEQRIASMLPDVDARAIQVVRTEDGGVTIPKSIVLKPWISDQEKGVVFISFEEQWLRLLGATDLAAFAQRYQLVVSPSWSPPHHLATTVFPQVYPDKIVTLISNRDDLTILPRLSEKFVPVELYASSWVNPEWFTPVPPEEKDIDLLMVANFALYKRHFALFRALREMPTSTRVVLIGRRDGQRTATQIEEEAAAYGVAGRYELILGAPDQDLFRAIARARTCVILSRREGSCVFVAESMLANTPVGLLADAGIGSKAFINERTGVLLEHRELGRQLTRFIERARAFAPRAWMLEHEHHCFGSTKRLNAALKQHALSSGQHWTRDIVSHHWRPDPTYVQAEDRAELAPEQADIQSRFGVLIGPRADASAPAVVPAGNVTQGRGN